MQDDSYVCAMFEKSHVDKAYTLLDIERAECVVARTQ
jgi:hypothetical protein